MGARRGRRPWSWRRRRTRRHRRHTLRRCHSCIRCSRRRRRGPAPRALQGAWSSLGTPGAWASVKAASCASWWRRCRIRCRSGPAPCAQIASAGMKTRRDLRTWSRRRHKSRCLRRRTLRRRHYSRLCRSRRRRLGPVPGARPAAWCYLALKDVIWRCPARPLARLAQRPHFARLAAATR
jgi:hypothetical protein